MNIPRFSDKLITDKNTQIVLGNNNSGPSTSSSNRSTNRSGSSKLSCCENPQSVVQNLKCRLDLIVGCTKEKGSMQVFINGGLSIINNPLQCPGSNLQVSLLIGGQTYFLDWINYNSTNVNMKNIIYLKPALLDRLLKAAENSGGKTRIAVLISGLLNSNISSNCRDSRLRKRVQFFADVGVKYINWNGSGFSEEDVSGPHCIGSTTSCGGDGQKKCPAKCCECCEIIGPDLMGTLEKPTKILVYVKQANLYIFRKEDNPCPDRTPSNTIIEKNLYTCAFDCECLNDQPNYPKLSASGLKSRIQCERGYQTCYQCILEEEGDCEYYTPLLSNSLPLSLEDLINQNLNK